MAQHYIVTKSNWQGDSWAPAAGPFGNKRDAQNQLAQYENHPHQMTGGIDLKNQIHAKVVSRSWLARNGYPKSDEGEYRLSEALFSARVR